MFNIVEIKLSNLHVVYDFTFNLHLGLSFSGDFELDGGFLKCNLVYSGASNSRM